MILDGKESEASKMDKEALRLIVAIVYSLSKDYIVPYHTYGGVDIGMCRYCGVIGRETAFVINYDHEADCVITLKARLLRLIEADEP